MGTVLLNFRVTHKKTLSVLCAYRTWSSDWLFLMQGYVRIPKTDDGEATCEV